MIDLEDFLARTGIDLRSLHQWIERDWLLAERRETTIILTDMDAARARFIRDLKRDFGVNDEGVEIALHLLDQVHGLRQALGQLQALTQADQRRTKRRLRRGRYERVTGGRRRP
jgi:chaperone modulatory protein CbpM